VVDGKFGYGQTVTPQAVRIGIEKCKKAGLAAVALRNAAHRPLWRLGGNAAAEGLVFDPFRQRRGLAAGGAPWRRREAAVDRALLRCIPRQGQDPIVLDFATSIVAEGKVLVASRGGKKLPDGALIDFRRHVERGSGGAVRAVQRGGPRDHTRAQARSARSRAQGLGPRLHSASCSRGVTGTGATAPDRRFANRHVRRLCRPQVVDTSHFFDGEISRYVDLSGRPSRSPASMPC